MAPWAHAAPEVLVTFEQAIALSRGMAPDVVVARGRESVANAEIGVAGVYPNPTAFGGTSTQAAKLSLGVSVPLVILGQRGAAIRAARADLDTVRTDTAAVQNDVRTASAKAFIALWHAERTATARAEAAALARRIEGAVGGRVELGAAPAVEGLRVHAERLRADADAEEAAELVNAAGADLARYIGVAVDQPVRAKGDPQVPDVAPPIDALLGRAAANPTIRREELDARAAEARVLRERALVRPALTLDLGVDAYDPTLGATNYRAQLGVEVPIFNQRGAFIDRERANAAQAQSRAGAQKTRLTAGLVAAYRTFGAVSARRKALEEGVVPAADAAANATEESYTLGHSPLVAVLDAERARVEAHLALIDARAARANAWADVEQAAGWP